jgi:ABC-2 type transport system permease protein
MLLYSMTLGSYALAGFFFFSSTQTLSQNIISGELDKFMVKPINPLWHLIAFYFNPGYLSHLSLSIILMTFCFIRLEIQFTVFKILFLVIVMISSAAIHGAGMLISSAPIFWTKRNAFGHWFYWMSKQFIEYPVTIYGKAVQVILTFLMPWAFISFYPAQYFLSKDDFGLFSPVLQYCSPLVAVILMGTGLLLWHKGLNVYESTGT